MTDRDAELYELWRLPDPCTLIFGIPRDAPAPVDADGRAWHVAHWSHLAGRAGHRVLPSNGGVDDGDPTWCGDVVIEGLTYQVHRGLRRRMIVDTRFGLEESVWVEPAMPAEEPAGPCPWCDEGPPAMLRHVGEAEDGGVYLVGVSEFADGAGRSIVFCTDPDEDGHSVVLEPFAHTVERAVVECAASERSLRLVFDGAVSSPAIGPTLRFRLELSPDHRATLRAGLRRVFEGEDVRLRL